jgi:hypothetical protein
MEAVWRSATERERANDEGHLPPTSDVPIWTSLLLHESLLLKTMDTSRKLSTLRPSSRNPVSARRCLRNTVG